MNSEYAINVTANGKKGTTLSRPAIAVVASKKECKCDTHILCTVTSDYTSRSANYSIDSRLRRRRLNSIGYESTRK